MAVKTEASANSQATKGASLVKVSFFENLAFNLCHIIPMTLQGTFTRSKFWVGFFGKFHSDPMAVRFITKLRNKHRSDYLGVKMLGTPTVMVLADEGIRHVLELSPAIYADPKSKHVGMSHFQPNAVTISRGDDWKDRRWFNDTVVGSPPDGHPLLKQIEQIIGEEVTLTLHGAPRQLVWDDFDKLFERIMLRITFGNIAADDSEFAGRLQKMMKEANGVLRLLIKPYQSKEFDPFYATVRAYLDREESNSLVHLCKHAQSTETTRVENQIPHWMFAQHETLAINSFRCLALISTHEQVAERVRKELGGNNEYLEGCLQEAMRLWPTTPMLVREAVATDKLDGIDIPAGWQTLIPNHFLHRDRQNRASADTFVPEYWAGGKIDIRFNHLSNGSQICAGKALALFIGRTTLATLLQHGSYTLDNPPFQSTGPLPYKLNHFKLVFTRN